MTRRVDEPSLIFICTQSRWTADLLLSQSHPTGTMLKGGLQVSVWAACATVIRRKVKHQEDLRHSGVCKVFILTCQNEPTEAMCYGHVTRALNKGSKHSDSANSQYLLCCVTFSLFWKAHVNLFWRISRKNSLMISDDNAVFIQGSDLIFLAINK